MLLLRIILGESELRIDIRLAYLTAALGVTKDLLSGEYANPDVRPDADAEELPPGGSTVKDAISISIPMKLRRRGLETKLILDVAGNGSEAAEPDQTLVRMIANAHQWWEDLIAHRFPLCARLLRHTTRMKGTSLVCCSSPSSRRAIVNAIVNGTQPVEMTAQRLIKLAEVPPRWTEQSFPILGSSGS